MYQIVEGNAQGQADVGNFIDLINAPPVELHDFFDPKADIFIARAPGRLDVMGGIADYSGSLVLEMPTAEATLAAVQKSGDETIKIASLSGGSDRHFSFETKLSDLVNNGEPLGYESIKQRLSKDPSNHWASYVAGVFFVLRHELGVDFQNGARILISSRVPIGKGVSSSAALEVAAMQAICTAFDIRIEQRELALLCQKVENSIVGAPCGVMDQITVHCGVENSLISLLCQPAEMQGTIEIPDEIEFWGLDSGVRHTVAGSDYTSVRIGAFMGYRIIAGLAGLEVHPIKDGVVTINDARWHGYLANVSPAEYENDFVSKLPETIGGADFIKKYGGTTDRVTNIDPAKVYAIKEPTSHAIYENFRVRAFSEMLQYAKSDKQWDALGELMFQSHASYAACGLTEKGTDRIVDLVRGARDKGVFGARITGGGSGGTVAILARRNRRSVIAEIAGEYECETGRKPYIFHGSSPGCSAFGHLQLSLGSGEPAISD
jgi:galactokinase